MGDWWINRIACRHVCAGRELGDLHVNYEAAEPYPVVVEQGDLRLATITDPKAFFRVTKMRVGGQRRPGRDAWCSSR